MYSPFLLLLLLISLFSHACNARLLGAVRHDPGKDVENLKFERTLIPQKPMQSSFVEQHKPMNSKEAVDERVSSEDPSDSNALSRDVKGTRGAISGYKNLMSSSDVGLQQTTKLEENGRRTRSVLGSVSDVGHVAITREESIESGETHVGEDLVAMDYEPPHLTPPIHNQSP